MTEEKKNKIKEIRTYLKGLTESQRQELTARIGIHNIEGHILSMRNQLSIYYQSGFGQTTINTVAGFRQWLKAGRVVKKGEHGFIIWFPVGDKDEEGDIDNPTKFYTATVFDISQTDELTKPKEL